MPFLKNSCLLVIWLSVMLMPAAAREEFDVGMLACVVQLERVEPNQPPILTSQGAKQKITASAHSSAFLVEDPYLVNNDPNSKTGRVFVVTAAHNLVECVDVKISIPVMLIEPLIGLTIFHSPPTAIKLPPTELALRELPPQLKPFVYFDQAEDLAMVELTAPWANYLNSQKSKVKIVGELLRHATIDRQILPRGGIASAAGTIQDDLGDSIHPAYSCTLSRYIPGSDLAAAVDPNYRTPSNGVNLPSIDFRRKVFDRIKDSQFLIVESMSITAGFSGSPIMISQDHFLQDGKIVGVVLGGHNNPAIGRSAWAMPAGSIERAIRYLANANDDKLIHNGPDGWKKIPTSNSDAGFTIAEDPKHAGRWVFNRGIQDIKSVLGNQFRTPYVTRFNIESRVEFRASEKGATLCGRQLKAKMEGLPGRSFVFRGITFDRDCLNQVNLLTPYFDGCTFNATLFHGSVLTGPTFDNCIRRNEYGQIVPITSISDRPCATCSPAAIIAAIFKEARVSERSGDQDDLLKFAK